MAIILKNKSPSTTRRCEHLHHLVIQLSPKVTYSEFRYILPERELSRQGLSDPTGMFNPTSGIGHPA